MVPKMTVPSARHLYFRAHLNCLFKRQSSKPWGLRRFDFSNTLETSLLRS